MGLNIQTLKKKSSWRLIIKKTSWDEEYYGERRAGKETGIAIPSPALPRGHFQVSVMLLMISINGQNYYENSIYDVLYRNILYECKNVDSMRILKGEFYKHS